VVGGSTGTAGAFPANGFNTSLITLARTLGGGVAALGVAGRIVTSACGVTTVLFTVDADHRVDTVVTAGDTAALGFDSKVVAEGVFTTTLLAPTVLLGPALSVAAGEEPGEFVSTLADMAAVFPNPDCVAAVGDDW
jgi:hypothetical protein